MTYKVTAPLVIVKDKAGVMHHVYEGGLVPDDADPEHLKQLRESGMVKSVKATEAPAEPKADGAPKGNASRDEWAKFAADRGAPEDETKPVDEGGLSQSALRDKYGK